MSMRYFEGLAAGTRLLGVLPRSGEYETLLPVDAFCQVAPDGSDLAKRLDEDGRNPERQRTVDAACAFVHKHHSWRRRAEQLYNRLANDAPFNFRLRKRNRARSNRRSGPRKARAVADASTKVYGDGCCSHDH